VKWELKGRTMNKRRRIPICQDCWGLKMTKFVNLKKRQLSLSPRCTRERKSLDVLIMIEWEGSSTQDLTTFQVLSKVIQTTWEEVVSVDRARVVQALVLVLVEEVEIKPILTDKSRCIKNLITSEDRTLKRAFSKIPSSSRARLKGLKLSCKTP
jgi:hypothetical protein